MLDEGPAPQRIVNSSSPRSSPTFVQIRKPATAGDTRRTVGILLGGLCSSRVGLAGAARSAAAVCIRRNRGPSPQMADAPNTYPDAGTPMPEPVALALQEAPPPDDTAAAAAGPEMALPAGTPASEPQAAMLVAPVVETSARLKKGGTVAGALHGLGIATKDVGNAVAALKARVRLNRLPVGQEITVKMGPADDARRAAPARAHDPARAAARDHARARRQRRLQRRGADLRDRGQAAARLGRRSTAR